MKTNLLYISPDFNYSCGVSKHVYINLKYLSENSDIELFFITNKGDSLERLSTVSNLNFSLLNFEKDHKNIFRLLFDLFKLYSYCLKYKIDIIHTHHRYPELLSVLVSKFCNIKTITTVHSFVNGLTKVSFRSQKIITVSKAVEEHLYKHYPHTKGKCLTYYNCIDNTFIQNDAFDSFQFRKSLGYSPDDKLLLFVGRFNKKKGADVLVVAFRKLPPDLNIKLMIVGPLEDAILQQLLTQNRKDIWYIEPQRDIKPYYNIADVVVLPSREDSFPYVMLEAGAMKKPFIGSRTGGIAEFINDGINGFLVEPGNIAELAQKIVYVIKNMDLAKQVAQRLYHKIVVECNCVEYIQKLEKIYSN